MTHIQTIFAVSGHRTTVSSFNVHTMRKKKQQKKNNDQCGCSECLCEVLPHKFLILDFVDLIKKIDIVVFTMLLLSSLRFGRAYDETETIDGWL